MAGNEGNGQGGVFQPKFGELFSFTLQRYKPSMPAYSFNFAGHYKQVTNQSYFG